MARQNDGAAWPRGARSEVAPEERHPNHHLWRNGRLWWIAFTVHRGHRQERVRLSLETNDLAAARERRDALIARFAEAPDLAVSLRFVPRRDAFPAKQVA